jgi:hypothetical protein
LQPSCNCAGNRAATPANEARLITSWKQKAANEKDGS